MKICGITQSEDTFDAGHEGLLSLSIRVGWMTLQTKQATVVAQKLGASGFLNGQRFYCPQTTGPDDPQTADL